MTCAYELLGSNLQHLEFAGTAVATIRSFTLQREGSHMPAHGSVGN